MKRRFEKFLKANTPRKKAVRRKNLDHFKRDGRNSLTSGGGGKKVPVGWGEDPAQNEAEKGRGIHCSSLKDPNKKR